MGVDWVRHIDRTYDVGKMQATLREALTTEEKGPKVIVASSECMLNRQRREKPLVDKAIKGGERVVKPKFGVDEDICTGDHACMRLSGCPSLSVKSLDDPLRDDPVAHIDQSCVGCGNCGEVADAAVLCPSFYRADVVHNPGRWDRFLEAARRASRSACCSAPRKPAPDLRRCLTLSRHCRAEAGAQDDERVIKLAVLAVGGQGGGVLADWIIDVAERNGYRRAVDLGRRRRAAHRRHDLLCRDVPATPAACRSSRCRRRRATSTS